MVVQFHVEFFVLVWRCCRSGVKMWGIRRHLSNAEIYGVLYIIDYDDRNVEDVLEQTSINMF